VMGCCVSSLLALPSSCAKTLSEFSNFKFDDFDFICTVITVDLGCLFFATFAAIEVIFGRYEDTADLFSMANFTWMDVG